ncbi:hypothetical protein ABZ468_45850 [Streptomyces sp. NPDC005708]|uniref:hypothetical protein n=1 Tax=Streptomyces sp. NPDC005708 TaxID=3154564 RepID=UPI0033D580D4
MTRPDFPVPYIAAWSGEHKPMPRVVQVGDGIMLAGQPRDKTGVSWQPWALRQGAGRPEYGKVHGPRQRRAMRRNLCQVCGGPADRNELGWLWLLEDHRADGEPGWPQGEVTTHPPVCRPCAPVAARLCPHLRDHVIAARVGLVILDGVYGQLYTPGPIPAGRNVALFNSPCARWLVGSQLAASLLDVTLIDLPKVTTHAPEARATAGS